MLIYHICRGQWSREAKKIFENKYKQLSLEQRKEVVEQISRKKLESIAEQVMNRYVQAIFT
jgi:arsenate reductase-like glutaredoxin family protein